MNLMKIDLLMQCVIELSTVQALDIKNIEDM